jgi:hypothetical protein
VSHAYKPSSPIQLYSMISPLTPFPRYCVRKKKMKKDKKEACPTSANEREMDEFISIMSPLPVSNCLNEISL